MEHFRNSPTLIKKEKQRTQLDYHAFCVKNHLAQLNKNSLQHLHDTIRYKLK